jgi:hypothetical protein
VVVVTSNVENARAVIRRRCVMAYVLIADTGRLHVGLLYAQGNAIASVRHDRYPPISAGNGTKKSHCKRTNPSRGTTDLLALENSS